MILITTADLSTPLSEHFNALQELITKPEVDLVVGWRNTAKKKRSGQKSVLQKAFEEKASRRAHAMNLGVHDPLCPFVAFRRSALDQLLPNLQMKTWYYTPEILEQARLLHLVVVEIPIHFRDQEKSQFRRIMDGIFGF